MPLEDCVEGIREDMGINKRKDTITKRKRGTRNTVLMNVLRAMFSLSRSRRNLELTSKALGSCSDRHSTLAATPVMHRGCAQAWNEVGRHSGGIVAMTCCLIPEYLQRVVPDEVRQVHSGVAVAADGKTEGIMRIFIYLLPTELESTVSFVAPLQACHRRFKLP